MWENVRKWSLVKVIIFCSRSHNERLFLSQTFFPLSLPSLPSCLCKALCYQILHLQLSSPLFESVRWQLGTRKSSRGSGQQGFQVVGGHLQVIVTGETKKEKGSLACPCPDCLCKYSCFLSSLTLSALNSFSSIPVFSTLLEFQIGFYRQYIVKVYQCLLWMQWVLYALHQVA